MRVALLSPLFESVPPRLYGGTERVVYNLCRGLTEANVEVTVFASGDSSVEGRIEPVVEEALRLSQRRIIDPNAYNFKMLSMVAEQAEGFDLIHNHHDYWMLPLAQMVSTPVLTTAHGRLDLPEVAAVYSSYPNASFVSISNSQRHPLPMLRWMRTIYHGIGMDDYQFYEKPGKYLAFLGRIDASKRPDLAIAIAKQSGVPLKIAAKIEGAEAQSYYDAHVKPHVDGRFIEFVGEISEREKSDFLGNALGLCFPIDWPEPFGLVMIEALACGTPVLARPFGSVPEILKDGVTGFVDSDVRVLASKVKDLPGISRRNCRQWVEQRFSLGRMAEEYIHVYRKLTEFTSATHRHRRDLLHPVMRIADRNS
jgi:glycosyltransferase involved in cell wall biosynthesis